MPELSNNFMKGRMNKDLDDRLVPEGEYRDALNIEVSTSESSDVGALQNIKGNTNISNVVFEPKSRFNADSAQVLYLDGQVENIHISQQSWVPQPGSDVNVSITSDKVFEIESIGYTGYDDVNTEEATLMGGPWIGGGVLIRSQSLVVGREYSVSYELTLDYNDYSSGNFLIYSSILGQPEDSVRMRVYFDSEGVASLLSYTDNIWNQNINFNEYGSINVQASFYADSEYLDIFVSRSFNGSISNIGVYDKSIIDSTNRNAINVGSKADTATDTIYNFVHKASDFKLNSYSTPSEGKKQALLGIRSDCIIQHKPSAFEDSSVNKVVLTDVYSTRLVPIMSNGKLPMYDINQNPINNEITGLPYIIDNNANITIQGVRPGMKISLLDPNNNNVWAGKGIVVKSVSYDTYTNSGKITISPVPNSLLINDYVLNNGYILEFNSKRVLNFSLGTSEAQLNTQPNSNSETPLNSSITAINIVDGFLYYTDNKTEPKKININRGIESTVDIFNHTEYEEINSLNPVKYYLEEKYISVIKAKPTHAPKLTLSNSNRKGGGIIMLDLNSTQFTGFTSPVASKSHYYVDSTSSIISEYVNGESQQFSFEDELAPVRPSGPAAMDKIGSTYSIISSVSKVNWRVGDTLTLTGVSSQKSVEVRITSAMVGEDESYNLFDIVLINISDAYAAQENPQAELFIADLNSSNILYENSFVSFALRYKYNNDEYSAIGPYSEPAFLPGRYLYKASIGFNEAMINTLSSLDIYNFVTPSVCKDVKSIDIILKDNFSTNAYLIKSISKNSKEWDLNNFEITSEMRGTTIPSLQLSRIYDAVPLKAKAQEFIASRLMYGNYTEGYNMLDNSMSDINFSCQTGFENISTNSSDHITASVNSGYDNDLIAQNYPFFNPEDTSNTRFIHNYYKSNQDTFFNENGFPGYGSEGGNNLYCPKDIDQLWRFNEVPGTGPRYNSFLIPIFPVNEHVSGNTDTTLAMPTIFDPAGQSYNVGATGNYQVYSTTHSDHYNSSDHDDYQSRNLPSQVKPLIYKAPVDGTYNIKASTEALVRYYYGTSTPGMTALQSDQKSYKRLPFRIEIHKVNINGVSQGIINDSIDLIGNSDGLAVSQSNMQTQTNWYGSSFGEDTLQETRSGFIPYSGGNTSIAPFTKEVELHREVSLTAGEYVAIFFSYQKSYDNNTNIGTTTVDHTGNNGNVWSHAINDDNSSIRFLLDADKTKLEISAPQIVSNIQVKSPSKSVRSNRFYETGVVYSDAYGRDTTVMKSKGCKVEIPISYSDKKNALTCSIESKAPYWATHYKYYIKESSNKYFNMVLDAAYSNDGTEGVESNYYWLSFNSSDISKVNVDDNLILKKQHGNNNAVNDKVHKIKVLSISEEVPESISSNVSSAQGKFFVKVKTSAIRSISSAADDDFAESLYDADGSIHSDNGAVFEVEPKGTVREGFYWETSKAYPITLNEVSANDYIEVDDYVQILHIYNPQEDKFVVTEDIRSWNKNNVAKVTSIVGAKSFPYSTDFVNPDTTCNINVNTTLSSFSIPNVYTGQYVVAKFIKKDGSYVTGRIIGLYGSSLRLAPYTHPTGKTCVKIPNKVSLPWFNCYQWYNGVETDIIRDDFSGSTVYAYTSDTGKQSGFNASDYYPDYKQVVNKSDIIYSQIYNDSSNIDASNQFILADKIVKKLNRSHGQINSLIARNNDIIALCEDKILKILSSGKDALFNADGNIQLTSSSNVLGQSIPFVGDFGCQHPESIALDEYRIYFVDKARGAVLRLSRDGITEISSNGMDNWFNSKLERTQSAIGSFDDSKSEYNVTLHEVISTGQSKNVYTLSFDESTNGWVSFKSFIKESGLSLNNKYYTFKAGRLYKHHSDIVNRNRFYNKQYESNVTTLINMQPGVVKSFRTISYEGSQSKIVNNNADGQYVNIVSVNGWSVDSIKTDQQEGKVDEFIEKEGKWFNNIKGK